MITVSEVKTAEKALIQKGSEFQLYYFLFTTRQTGCPDSLILTQLLHSALITSRISDSQPSAKLIDISSYYRRKE